MSNCLGWHPLHLESIQLDGGVQKSLKLKAAIELNLRFIPEEAYLLQIDELLGGPLGSGSHQNNDLRVSRPNWGHCVLDECAEKRLLHNQSESN